MLNGFTGLIWINTYSRHQQHTLHRIRCLSNGDEDMTTYEQLYLAMVIIAFVSFGIVLATMSYRQGKK